MDDPTAAATTDAGPAAPPTPIDATARDELERATERWFVRRGVPHFISDYSASRDIFTRASGFLIFVFVLELLNALNETFTWWQNLLAMVGAIVIAAAGLAGVNRLRGRRPLQRPDTIGPIELTAFVVVPAIIPYAVGGLQVAQAIDIAVGNLFVLLVVFVVTGYGLVPMTRWAIVQMFQQTRNITNLFVRSLPLLLLFTMFMFFNAEVWKIVDDLPNVFFAVAIGILVLVGSAFVLLRFPRELQAMSTFESWADIAGRAEGTPMAGVATAGLAEPPAIIRLGRRARVNVGLVLFASQAIQILLVTFAIGLFYVAFGLFTIVQTTVEQWTGSQDLEEIARWDLGGHDLLLSNELIRTAIFIAAIAGLQFTIAALTDSTYRDEFYDEITRDVRQAIAVRDLYLARVVDGDDAVEATLPTAGASASSSGARPDP